MPKFHSASLSFLLKPRAMLVAYPELVNVSENFRRTLVKTAQESASFDHLLEYVKGVVHKVAPETRCYYADSDGDEITPNEVSNDVIIMVELDAVHH